MSGTTWVAWGSGRVPVGVNASDTNFSTVEKTGGESAHKLTVSEMPKHLHNLVEDNSNVGTSKNIADPFNVSGSGWTFGNGGSAQLYTTGNMTLSIDYSGGDSSHNNLQPYITCYMWKRTA